MNELQESLRKCRVEGNVLFLPSINEGMLPNYKEVRQALLNAGATYKKNSFVFPNNAQAYIDRLMGGEKVNIKKEFQFFGTPKALADKLVKLSCIEMDSEILEPSAGHGAIVDAIVRVLPTIWVDCCELMDINRNVLSEHTNSRIICEDFLKIPKKYLGYYDRIIANPPFNKNQDIDHIRKMYDCLKKGGRMVSIASKHWQLSENKKEKAFADWLDEKGAMIEDIPSGTFKESGTTVAGVIITIDK